MATTNLKEVTNAAKVSNVEPTVETVDVVDTNSTDIVNEYENNTNVKLSYQDIIKKILLNGGKRINGVKIKNVNYEERDNYTRVSFTLNKYIPGYVSFITEDGTTGYKLGQTNTIFVSLYAITGAFKEDENIGWMANTILEHPAALNLILNGATIDIVQENIKANTDYYNPFSTNENQIPQNYDHDVYINNVVKYKLSKVGEQMSFRLADKLFGF